MILLDHRPIGILLLCLLAIVVGLCVFRFVRLQRRSIRLPARAISILIAAGAGFVLLISGFIDATTLTGIAASVFSPDRKRAIVVRNWDAGPLGGGGSYVNLYSYGGLREETIAGGTWNDHVAVRWTSNSDVELYAVPSGFTSCDSTASVRVTCLGDRPDRPDVR